MSDHDRLNPIRVADDALAQALSAQRFQAVVERVSKQVKVPNAEKGAKKSKWVDTDKFTFSLFPGAAINLPMEQAQELVAALNTSVNQLLTGWRAAAREHINDIVAQDISLSSAKTMQECLRAIERIDAIGYYCEPVNATEHRVSVRGCDGVTLTGDNKDMLALLRDANKALATLTHAHREQVTERLRAAVAAIP